MTRGSNEGSNPPEDRLEEAIAHALADEDKLIPTSEDEVARAEEEEFLESLPAGLRTYRHASSTNASAQDVSAGPDSAATEPDPVAPRSVAAGDMDQAVRLPSARPRALRWVKGGLGYAAAAEFGYTEATLILLHDDKQDSRVVSISAGNERVAEQVEDEPDATPTAIGPVRTCSEDCCAGSACPTAKEGLAQCSSGRRCISCDVAERSMNSYRLRVGTLLPSATQDSGKPKSQGPLSLCFSVGPLEATCVPAHTSSSTPLAPWRLLRSPVSTRDLLTGLRVEVRRGETELAAWQSPVALRPELLCRGLVVKPRAESGEVFGSLSIFLEDAHFVELGRADTVRELLALQQRFEFQDITPRIYQTEGNQRRFALAAGPFDEPTAERLRWKLLDAGKPSRLTLGSDLRGEARPTPP